MKQPRWMPASASRSLCAGRRLTPASKLWCIVRTQVHQATHVFPVGSEVESLGQHVSHIVCCGQASQQRAADIPTRPNMATAGSEARNYPTM